MNYLEKLKKTCEAATPGPLLEREDYDYYQNGTYLGIGPYHYSGPPNNRKVSGARADGVVDYFEKNVCRVESGDADKEFIKAAYEALPRLVEAVEALSGGLEKIAAASERVVTGPGGGGVYIDAGNRDVARSALAGAQALLEGEANQRTRP